MNNICAEYFGYYTRNKGINSVTLPVLYKRKSYCTNTYGCGGVAWAIFRKIHVVIYTLQVSGIENRDGAFQSGNIEPPKKM